MPRTSKVSIITISKNNAQGLKKTIASVVQQNYASLEHIIIDGASTDESLRIIQDSQNFYKDRNILAVSEPDRGISHAFNKGLALSTGDWVNFLNSGDQFLYPEAISTYAKFFADAPIVTAFSRFGKKRIPKTIITNNLPLHKRVWISHQATFIRRDVFGQIGGFEEKYNIRMDYDFFFRALRVARLKFIDQELVDYEPGGVSGRERWTFYKEECRVKHAHLSPSILHITPTIAKFAIKHFLAILSDRQSFV